MDRPRLSEAARLGDIDTLYNLIEENAYVLETFDLPPFGVTPLHIATQHGQIEFATAVMSLKPSFARKLDQTLFTPMHIAVQNIAVQNNNTDMVLWLLRLDNTLVRVKGKHGMTPFHHVIQQGNLDVMVAFLDACPECIEDINVRGENGLHIALKTNNFAAVQVLLGWVRRNTHPNSDTWETELFRGKDKEGNTVLHTAAVLNNHEAIQLLANYYPVPRKIQNSAGLTALDILQRNVNRGQERNIDIERLLSRAGRMSSYFQNTVNPNTPESLQTKVSKFKDFTTFVARQRIKIDGETRNAMLVVTILVLTIIFDGVYNPVGGLLPADGSNNVYTSPICNITCTDNTISPTCKVTCNNTKPIPNNTKPIPNTITHLPHVGMAVMNTPHFSFIWSLNTCTLILAYALTIYLLPPGYTDILFNAILLGLASSYAMSLMFISPLPYLGTITCFLFFCFYSLALAILTSNQRYAFIIGSVAVVFTAVNLILHSPR